MERKWLMNENLGEFYDVSSCKEDPEIDCGQSYFLSSDLARKIMQIGKVKEEGLGRRSPENNLRLHVIRTYEVPGNQWWI